MLARETLLCAVFEPVRQAGVKPPSARYTVRRRVERRLGPPWATYRYTTFMPVIFTVHRFLPTRTVWATKINDLSKAVILQLKCA